MRKLKLELDTLEVESFDTRKTEAPGVGTVGAHSFVTVDPNAGCGSDPPSQTCVETDLKWNTCGVSLAFMCLPTGQSGLDPC